MEANRAQNEKEKARKAVLKEKKRAEKAKIKAQKQKEKSLQENKNLIGLGL